MKFQFKAKNSVGEIVEGVREETDRFRLSHELIEEGFIPISITQAEERSAFSFASLNEIFIRIKLHEKIIFAKNLSAMLTAGLSLSKALSVLERQTDNIKLKRILVSVLHDVEGGKSLSQALARFPGVFSADFVAMVAAGEESGGLPQSLRLISEQLDKTFALRRKIQSAMIYPIVVLLAMVVIGILMLVYVVPNLTSTFKEFGAELPYSTKIIVWLSDFMGQHLVALGMIFIAFASGAYALYRSEKGQRAIDLFLIKMPIISNVVKQVNAATTARTMSSLIASGVTIVKSLEITADVLQNSFYKEVISGAVASIEKGEPLSAVFKKEIGLYPLLVGEMAEVGEETGNLPQMLLNMAVFYEGEVDSLTKDMSTVVEPFLMLFMGVAVGFFAIAVIQPIYSLSSGV